MSVVHSFDPGETPSCSASHQDPNYKYTAFLNIAKHFNRDRYGYGSVPVILFNLLKFSSVFVIAPSCIRRRWFKGLTFC